MEMKIVSEVYSESGKAGLNLGQAIIIAALVGRFFTQQPIGGVITLIGITIGAALIIGGLSLIQKAFMLKKIEEQSHGYDV
jgi:uncharacterized membrane protein